VDINALYYRIALTFIPGIGPMLAKNLVSYTGSVESIFKQSKNKLLKVPGVGDTLAGNIATFQHWDRVEKELSFIQKKNITPLFYLDDNYPKRLTECQDAPILLYYKGNADLNASRIISLVGTRKATSYGKEMVEKIVGGLADDGVLIVSGLAYGIDIYAHRAALQNNLSTVSIMAHGLDQVYPWKHRSTAAKMVQQGGILTEFPSETNPDAQNFPKRNRIMAGLADAVIVIESAAKGGAIITAEIANSYNRDVFAVPGDVGKRYSEGANFLIKRTKAALLDSADELKEFMMWEDEGQQHKQAGQRELFVELTPEEQSIVELMSEQKTIGIDELNRLSSLSSSQVANHLLNLEMKGILRSLPGNFYKLI
jgi:DNA processing protein